MKATLGTVSIQIGNAQAHILEVTKRQLPNGEVFYHVSCYVTYKNYVSPVFSLRVKDEKELLFKLRVEVAKMKKLIMEGHDKLFLQV